MIRRCLEFVDLVHFISLSLLRYEMSEMGFINLCAFFSLGAVTP